MFPLPTPSFVIAILLALSIHEWAHAYTAYRLGDPTAKMEGRMTINPLAHLDLIGSILFLIVGFGWGKPVPVDPRYFQHPKRDNAIVALAGPLSNLALTLLTFIMLLALGKETAFAVVANHRIVADSTSITVLATLLRDFLHINLVLMAFNLLPIAPLDGSKVLRPLIPLHYEDHYEAFLLYGPRLLLLLIILGTFLNVGILSWWIDLIVYPILELFARIASTL